MAELFLQELEPDFIARPTSDDLGYDLLVGFPNEKKGTNIFAVEVKATERPPAERFQIVRRTYERMAHSNVPGLLLVADVKHNQLYYGWLRSRVVRDTANVAVPLTELDEEGKNTLRTQLRAANGAVLAPT